MSSSRRPHLPWRIDRRSWSLTLLLVLTACQGAPPADTEGTPTASLAVAATGSPATAPTETAAQSPAHSPAATSPATATDAPTSDCTSPEPAAETSDWPLLQSTDGQLSLGYPTDWQDISGLVSQTIQVSFDQETLAESGQPADAELELAAVRSAANAFVAIADLEGIDSSAITLHDRHVAKVGIIGDEVRESGLQRCLDGELAAGFTARNTEGSYYQSWFISRDGVAYHALGVDPEDEGALDRLLEQIFSTWEWMD